MVLLKAKKYFKYKFHNPKKFWEDFGGEKYFNQFDSEEGKRGENIFLEKIEEFNPNSIVDIGCGYGRYLKAINKVFPNIELYGVDIAESQIKKAKKYLSECNNVSLAVTKNNVLPFDDNMFEMSITYGCFSAVKKGDLPFVYKEIERTTQKVGVFIEYFPLRNRNNNSKHYWFTHNYNLLFQKNNYMHKQLNELGDSLYIVEF